MAATAGAAGREMTPMQIGSAVIGVVFLLLGILGFIPGATTNYGDLTFVGPESGALLLGVFGVNMLLNIVYLVFGILGLAMARSESVTKPFLVIAGVIFLLLWILGLAVDADSSVNILAVSTATNWLHFVLGVVMVAGAAALPGGRR